jgi:GR25 family glycosyltransferase involved in LPS biosynthesis
MPMKIEKKNMMKKSMNYYPAIHWTDVKDEDVERYHFRHNAKMDYRKKVVACSLSHQDLLQKIINEDLKDVFIIEDDAIIENWDRLKELEGSKEFCYIGGQINAPLMKDFKKFEDIKDSVRDNFCKGINVIDPKEFRLAHTCGYYIPNRRVAQDILSNIPHGKKERAIDTEYIALQKKGKITKFVYPAIVTLYLPDANKGFSYSTYKLYDDQFLY